MALASPSQLPVNRKLAAGGIILLLLGLAVVAVLGAHPFASNSNPQTGREGQKSELRSQPANSAQNRDSSRNGDSPQSAQNALQKPDAAAVSAAQAEEAAKTDAQAGSEEFSQVTAPKIKGWGKTTDPDNDCKFFVSKNALIISTPASQNPHDFSPELGLVNAPRVVRPVAGDFTFQVQVDDRLNPGDESMIPGRTGYNGAAVIASADDQNVVTLARAVLKRPGEDPVPYANFEIRVDGELKQIGMTDHPLPESGPVLLKLERQGQQITGSFSVDGSKWETAGVETLPESWATKLNVGTMVVNSSQGNFSPQFSKVKLSKP